MCYNGLSRQIHPITNGSVDKTFELCSFLGAKINYCTNTIAQAGFSVGDRTVPFLICARQAAEAKNECYQNIIGQIHAYSRSATDTINWCSRIKDEEWRKNCS